MENKGISILLVVIIIAVVVLTGGFGYYYFFGKTQPATNQNQQQEDQNVSDETANWTTYTNQENGFEIKYPDSFDKTESAPIAGLLMLLLTDPSYPRGYYLRVTEYSTPQKSAEQWAQGVPGVDKTVITVLVQWIEGKKVVVKEGNVTRIFFSITKDNTIYLFSYYSVAHNTGGDYNLVEPQETEKSKTINYFDQILSTFKFTK